LNSGTSTIRCTFVNTKAATVRIDKVANGGDATFVYDISGALIGTGSPSLPDPVNVTTSGGTGSSATYTFNNLPAGGTALGISENALADWVLNSATLCRR
jgi:hypothetical protein